MVTDVETAIQLGRIAALEDEVHQLTEALERLAATAEFDSQLRAGSPGAKLQPGPIQPAPSPGP